MLITIYPHLDSFAAIFPRIDNATEDICILHKPYTFTLGANMRKQKFVIKRLTNFQCTIPA